MIRKNIKIRYNLNYQMHKLSIKKIFKNKSILKNKFSLNNKKLK